MKLEAYGETIDTEAHRADEIHPKEMWNRKLGVVICMNIQVDETNHQSWKWSDLLKVEEWLERSKMKLPGDVLERHGAQA